MTGARPVLFACFAALAIASPAPAQTWPEERPPGPLDARSVDIPSYEIRTLDNGLQVVVVPQHEQPAVSFRVLVKAGAVQEPADKPGVAGFVAALLDQGTTTKDAGDIATVSVSAGGVLGVSSGNELSFVSGAVIKDRTDLALALVAELLQQPAFAEEEIARQRQQAMSSLQVSYDDPDYLADVVFDRVVYGAHPYGRTPTPDSVARITRDDLVAFHRAWFAPNNALLAIVGDLPVEEAFAAAERAFGGWARRDVPDTSLPEMPSPVRRVVVVDRPGSAQTEIRVGHVGVARTVPEYVSVDLLIRILGGEGANRLFGVLRSDRGLTYGASASLNTFRRGGDIVAETDTRTSVTGEALRLIVDEFARLQRERVRVAELRGAQEFLAGNFPLTIETPGAIAQQVLAHLFYGVDLGEIETYRDQVEQVTPDDVHEAAMRYLRPDQLTVVLVGDASAFADQLRGVGFAEFERIPLSELDLNSPTLRRGAPGGRPDAGPVRK
jgi:zinc protease